MKLVGSQHDHQWVLKRQLAKINDLVVADYDLPV